MASLAQRGAALQQERLEWVHRDGRGALWDGPHMPVRAPDSYLSTHCLHQRPAVAALTPFRCAGCKPAPSPTSLPCLRSKQACACGFQGWSLNFLQPTGFSNQQRGLVFPVLDRRAGVPNMYFRPLTPKENLPPHDSPLPVSVPS